MKVKREVKEPWPEGSFEDRSYPYEQRRKNCPGHRTPSSGFLKPADFGHLVCFRAPAHGGAGRTRSVAHVWGDGERSVQARHNWPTSTGNPQEAYMTRKSRYTYLSEYNGEPIVTEPGLQDCEKESAFYFSERTTKQGYIQASSNHAPIVRGLLQDEDYIPDEIIAIGEAPNYKVVSTAGRLPTNCLRITTATGSLSVGKIITQSARGKTSEHPAVSSEEPPTSAPLPRRQEVVV